MLRQKDLKLERQLKELIEVARANDVLAAKIHELTMQLLRLHDLQLPDRSRRSKKGMRSGFGADEAVLVHVRRPGMHSKTLRVDVFFALLTAIRRPEAIQDLPGWQFRALRPGTGQSAGLPVSGQCLRHRFGRAGAARRPCNDRLPRHRQQRCRALPSRHEHRLSNATRRPDCRCAKALLASVRASGRRRLDRQVHHAS